MELHQAWIHALLGKEELAKEKYKQAVVRLEEPWAENPDDPRYNSALGMALAGAGQRDRGIKLALKATEILSYEKDACYGINPMYDLAATYTLAGEWDKAFEQVEFCLANPGYFTIEYLKADPRYHSLRSDPRYEALLEKYALPKQAL
jgi:tetratricopeptide (TPR) repeat protein